VSSGLRSTSSVRRDQATLCITSACAVALFLIYGRILTVSLLAPSRAPSAPCRSRASRSAALVALLLRDRFEEPLRARRISRLLAAFGFAAPFSSLMVMEHLPIDQTLSGHGLVTVTVASLVLAAPFALAGIIGAASLIPHGGVVHRMWGERRRRRRGRRAARGGELVAPSSHRRTAGGGRHRMLDGASLGRRRRFHARSDRGGRARRHAERPRDHADVFRF
jgi:hypothetical protein